MESRDWVTVIIFVWSPNIKASSSSTSKEMKFYFNIHVIRHYSEKEERATGSFELSWHNLERTTNHGGTSYQCNSHTTVTCSGENESHLRATSQTSAVPTQLWRNSNTDKERKGKNTPQGDENSFSIFEKTAQFVKCKELSATTELFTIIPSAAQIFTTLFSAQPRKRHITMCISSFFWGRSCCTSY